MIMGEAVRLGHADANPLVSLKLKRDKAAKKPELADAEIAEIREALNSEPEWIQTAFDISLNTGCRLSRTGASLFALGLGFTKNPNCARAKGDEQQCTSEHRGRLWNRTTTMSTTTA